MHHIEHNMKHLSHFRGHESHAPHGVYFISSLVIAMGVAILIVLMIFLGVSFLTGL